MVSQPQTTSFGPGLVCAGPGLPCVPRCRPSAQCQLLHAPCKHLEHNIPRFPAQHCTLWNSCEQNPGGRWVNNQTPRQLFQGVSHCCCKGHSISMKPQNNDHVHVYPEHCCPFSCSRLQLWLLDVGSNKGHLLRIGLGYHLQHLMGQQERNAGHAFLPGSLVHHRDVCKVRGWPG